MSDLSKKILLSIGLGAVVVAPIAISYYLLKDGGELEELKRCKEKKMKKREVEIKMLIKSDAVGSIIGKAGEIVRRIQDETRTRIDFADDKNTKGDKIATIRGTNESVLDAEATINRILANQPILYSETIIIPNERVGRVIGKEGEVVHSIAAMTDTKIDVSRNPPHNCPGTPVTIKGTVECIRRARKRIEDIVKSVSKNDSFRNSWNQSRNNSLKFQRKTYSQIANGGSSTEPVTEELIPTQDGHLQVYVSTAKTPDKFWLQIFGTKSNDLDKLTEQMTDFYEVEINRLETKLGDVKVGDIIAAPFNMDQSWYRVRVVGVEEDDQIRVYYMDFGDEATHSKDSLCSLKSEFLHALTFQAVECSLAGVKAPDGVWTEECNQVFCELTHAGNWIAMKAFPVSKVGNSVAVDLVDFKDLENPINITDELVARGMAVKVESD